MENNKPKKPFYKKWWVWVLAVIIIGGIGANMSDTPKKVASTSAKNTKTEKKETKNNAPQIFKLGDVVQLKDFKITVNGIRTATQDKSGFIKADKGNEFLLVNCSIENISDENKAISSIMMFKVVDKDGQSYDQEMFADCKGQLDGEIGPTRKIKGEYAVQVPKGKKGLELVFDSSLLSGGQVIVELR